jgi:uncharacterized membrane protein YeiH
MVNVSFQLPIYFDLTAAFLVALTGVWAASRRGYDVVGAFVLAFVTGLGGGVLRDAVFLQEIPLAMRDRRYLWAILAALLVAPLIQRVARHLERIFTLVDASATGIYGVYGVNKALLAGLPPVAAILVGVCNAVGGGLLRDVLVREEPQILKPGKYEALAALAGCTAFAGLSYYVGLGVRTSAGIAIFLTVALRLLSLFFDWKTHAWGRWRPDDSSD